MSSIPSSFLYQAPPDAAIKAQYIGQRIGDVQAPAAIIDLAVVKRNCSLMLSAAETLKVQFRAHVKTHKVCLDCEVYKDKTSYNFQTTELAKLQAGETGPVRLIVSTIPELEHLIPWLLECVKQGRVVDVCLPTFSNPPQWIH
jgi:hypothetical protein